MSFKETKSIQFELNNNYIKYFDWFKKQELFLKNGIKTSHPFFINIENQIGTLSEKIDTSNIILVYGQETYGYPSKNWLNHNLLKDTNIGEFFNKNNSYSDSILLNKLCSLGFDFPNFREEIILLNDNSYNTNFKSHFKGPFWNLIRKLREKNKYIVWSNILKFDVYREGSPKRRIRKTEILENGRQNFYNVHKKLLIDEIQAINPGKILFLSSPNEKGSIYNEILNGILDFDSKNEESYFKSGNILNLQNFFIQSYHPRRLNLDERSKLLESL